MIQRSVIARVVAASNQRFLYSRSVATSIEPGGAGCRTTKDLNSLPAPLNKLLGSVGVSDPVESNQYKLLNNISSMSFVPLFAYAK